MADRGLDDYERQERNQFLRYSPFNWSDTKDGMVHAPANSARDAGRHTKACGRVEVDETFIGGKARNVHKWVRAKKITGTVARTRRW